MMMRGAWAIATYAEGRKRMIAEIMLAAMVMTAPVYTPLTAPMGVNFDCPMAAETWYNLPMEGLIDFLYDLGWEGYHFVREDGVHMWHNSQGDFVMVGAYLPKHPRGSYVETSLGPGIVADTGYFYYGEDQIDIATTWAL